MKGTILKGRYEILELIDAGGMGLIYKGLDKKTEKIVAIKILKPDFTHSDEFVGRFKKEANAAFSLKHKNIVRVTDSGDENGIYYIIQEFVNGRTLKNIIQDKGPMEYQKAIRIMIDICTAIEYAHGKGLVHRDIKPQNIMIDKDGNVKVTDFGIAKDVTSSTITSMDAGIMGSVHYFSPEQARGEPVDTRSDIYSLGIVFYEMVTGELPFTGDTSIAVAIKHLSDTVRPPKEANASIPRSVNNIILKATRKDRELRYNTAGELKDDLIKAIVKPGGNFVRFKEDVEAKRLKKAKNSSKRNLLFLVMMTFLVVAILGTIVLMASNMFFADRKNALVVPKFTGMSEVDALDASSKIGMKIEKQYAYSDKVEDKHVISQNPKEGTSISGDESVAIVISQGKRPFEVPSLLDETVDTAKETLKGYGLTLGDITYEASDKPDGYIIAQSPEQGNIVTKGEAIAVVVSRAASATEVTVPLLKGKKLEAAAAILQQAGIKRFIIYEDESGKAEGTVLSQQPVNGVQQRSDELVSVWVSQYEDKPYSALTTVTATVSDPNTLVRVVLEENIKGEKAQFTAYEGTHNAGTVEIPLKIESRKKGKLSVVVYAENKEILRKELLFE